MAFAKASTKAEDVKQSGSAHISKSGIYPVTIIAPIVSISNGGSTTVEMYLEHMKQKQVIYGNLRVSNNDGGTNEIGTRILNQLIIIAEVDEVGDPIDAELPIGKKEAMKDCAVLEDLSDIEAFIRIQMEYHVHNGSIQESKVIKGFYRMDKATAEEIVNESDVGAGYEADQKYVNNVTYKDNLTEEQITQWVAAKRPKGTAGQSAGGTKGTTKKVGFGGKKRNKPAEDE